MKACFNFIVKTSKWFFFVLFLVFILSYWCDNVVLERIASGKTKNCNEISEKVLKLADFIYHNKGFCKNQHFVLFKKFRATPVQVLNYGGDCFDKSRLLVSLLKWINIKSTIIMLFHPITLEPVHTVTLVWLNGSKQMIVDPSHNLYFPKKDGFYSLKEMKNDRNILMDRIHFLMEQSLADQRLWDYYNSKYPVEIQIYDCAASFNWNKNRVTKILYNFLYSIIGDRISELKRNDFFERPKFKLAICFLVLFFLHRLLFILATKSEHKILQGRQYVINTLKLQ